MRIPVVPPDIHTLLRDSLDPKLRDPAVLSQIFSRTLGVTHRGRYLHWDKLRHLDPPEGYDHQLWWLAIKLSRRSQFQPLPLRDRQDQPFQFTMPDIAQERVHRIDRLAAGFIQSDSPLPGDMDQHRYLLRSLTEEAISSSLLEGAATTRQAAKRMLRDKLKPSSKGEQMIVNNYLGLRFIADTAKQKQLTPQDIFELHGILTRDTLKDPDSAGRFRREDEQIVVADVEGRTLHTPPKCEELPRRLAALCRFANADDDEPFIHPVVRSILLHFWLAYDHPFVDGNGRTARALFYWSMLKRGYWLMEYVSISRLLLNARSSYNRAFLYTETDENDATYFLLHQMRTIIQAIDALHAYLDKKMQEMKRCQEILRSKAASSLPLNHRQLSLIRHGIEHPGTVYTIAQHERYHSIGYATARSDLLALVEMGLFIKAKEGRKFTFLAPDDLGDRLQHAAERRIRSKP